MNRRILRRAAATLALACLAAVAGSAVPPVPPAAKGPKLVFKEEAWDFGKIKQGVETAHEFVFRNDGDAPLTIKGVETSCGCTAALVTDKKVAPGKSGKIKVTFSSRGYAGEVTKYVYVESDDAAEPRRQLKISAAVDVPPQPRIDLDRYSYDAGLLLEGEPLQAELVVRNRGELELQFEVSLEGAAILSGTKEAKFPVKVAAGKDASLLIRLPLANRVGLVREFALIKSNDPIRSTISMSLSGYIVTKDQLRKLVEKYRDVIK